MCYFVTVMVIVDLSEGCNGWDVLYPIDMKLEVNLQYNLFFWNRCIFDQVSMWFLNCEHELSHYIIAFGSLSYLSVM